jgi:uncharacterized protein (DUF1499 family)
MLDSPGGACLTRSRIHHCWTVGVVFMLGACAGVQVPPYGIREGELPACGETRSCLSSHDNEVGNSVVEPISYTGTRRDGRAALSFVLRKDDAARVVSSHRSYLRVEFSNLQANDDGEFYFGQDAAVDEVEFYFPPQRSVIHVRIVARSGILDREHNRQRLYMLQQRVNEYQELVGQGGLRL